ncbi:MAG TPA: DUF58 domain-containing protein [Bacteroidales bacterium]|nr:DUF58 domain-containing protein [Bacteroidales bacterium]HSA43648.1 DUF58 domain-containing protein [Bacteroidales bacterium]
MDFTLDQTKLQPFSQLEFIARQVVEGFITGLHKSPFHGFSVEFAEHRLYNTGESTRNIDWKLYGRTDRLYVKRYEEETNLRCQIVMDASSSMYYPVKESPSLDNPNKITFAVYAAAAIMALLKTQRDAVGLTVFTDTISLATRSKSNAIHHKYLYQQLEQLLKPIPVSEQRKTSAAPVLHEIADNIHKRSLVVIFSDMMETHGQAEELFSALQHLRHNKHEVILFHVVDKNKEIDFEFDNRPYRFLDLETGQELKVHPSEVKEHYTRAVSAFRQELYLRCGQYRIDLVEADINRGFRQVLMPYLLKREKLY